MTKQTLHDRYVAALIARGCIVTPKQPSGKYTRLTRPTNSINNHNCYYFIGRSGAVRYGATASDSFAASDQFKARLLDAASSATH